MPLLVGWLLGCLGTSAGAPPTAPAASPPRLESLPSAKLGDRLQCLAGALRLLLSLSPLSLSPYLSLSLSLPPPRQRGCSELGTLASWPRPGPRRPREPFLIGATHRLPPPLCPGPPLST